MSSAVACGSVIVQSRPIRSGAATPAAGYTHSVGSVMRRRYGVEPQDSRRDSGGSPALRYLSEQFEIGGQALIALDRVVFLQGTLLFLDQEQVGVGGFKPP